MTEVQCIKMDEATSLKGVGGKAAGLGDAGNGWSSENRAQGTAGKTLHWAPREASSAA